MIDYDTAVLSVTFLCGMLLLGRWHRDKDNAFDLRWIIVDTKSNRVSLFKVGQFVALVVSTWALIYEVRHNRLTEWLFVGYMISWAGANTLNKVVDKRNEPSKETS